MVLFTLKYNIICIIVLTKVCVTCAQCIHRGGRADLWDQVFEGVHDLGTLRLLVVGETASDDDHSRQHNTKVQLQKKTNLY